jgi:hypothetical protein
LKIDFAFNVMPNGKIYHAVMLKMAKFLIHKQQADYFVTDSIGRQEVFTVRKQVGQAVIDCEVVSDDIDWYNAITVQKNSGRWDFHYVNYASYEV